LRILRFPIKESYYSTKRGERGFSRFFLPLPLSPPLLTRGQRRGGVILLKRGAKAPLKLPFKKGENWIPAGVYPVHRYGAGMTIYFVVFNFVLIRLLKKWYR
jgi:hypothetical protein